MKNRPITSITLGDDTIDIIEGRTIEHEKCAVAHLAGPDGWGVTMNIRLNELACFISKPEWQRQFIAFAKDKLGVA